MVLDERDHFWAVRSIEAEILQVLHVHIKLGVSATRPMMANDCNCIAHAPVCIYHIDFGAWAKVLRSLPNLEPAFAV